ncbi:MULTISPECIES: GNAT family N-acetyltransferase [unclassified Acinetobacter]|uniref:GNAT family N-acetyltransferase n=1 Tax=unclassified Acinetobacter TaxID=196816 RepID=UPI001200BAB0|nr:MULTISPECIES: GNAT family N-acetyltransferase [unclassified Acinetobacter]RZJ23159.1 MAG: N-acetyltransferase family protein [Acinetobacter sp.]
MDFLIRPAQRQDLEQILKIYNAEILNGTVTWNSTPKSIEDFQHWFSDLITQQFPLLVAEHPESKQITGYADYSSFRQIQGFKQTVEHSVFIHPDFQGQGLGKTLMLKLMNHARQNQIHVMVAAIDHENQASIVLHEKLGFKQTGYMPEVGQKFGKWRDLVLMQLNLNT